jgi:hypothetical protein
MSSWANQSNGMQLAWLLKLNCYEKLWIAITLEHASSTGNDVAQWAGWRLVQTETPTVIEEPN